MEYKFQESHPGGGKRGPLQEKKSRLSQSARRAGRARPTQWHLHFVHQSRNVTKLCFVLLSWYPLSQKNNRFCHASVGYRRCFPISARNSYYFSFPSPTFELASLPHLRPAIFSPFCPSLASLWLHKGMASNSSPVIHWRKGHGYLLLISKDQAHKSRLEMLDFLILAPEIFTRNEPQVKVTLPLQVPSKHQSHRE